MTNFQISVLCLIATLAIYFANKRLYRRFHALPLMPLVFTPILLVLMLVFGHISWQNYIGESHWLLWLLGPATIAFAVPVYDNHCHLEISDGDEPRTLDEQLELAASVGVVGVVQAGGDIESSVWSADAAAAHPRVLAAVAIHPNEAPVYAEAGRLDEAIAVIDGLAAQPRVRAIGETGLDFFRTGEEGHAAQFFSRSGFSGA